MRILFLILVLFIIPYTLVLLSQEYFEAKQEPMEPISTVIDMLPNTEGYVVPWALCVNGEGYYSLMPTYFVYEEPGGTVSVYVYKDKDSYYYVDFPKNTDTGAVRRSRICDWGMEIPATYSEY